MLLLTKLESLVITKTTHEQIEVKVALEFKESGLLKNVKATHYQDMFVLTKFGLICFEIIFKKTETATG